MNERITKERLAEIEAKLTQMEKEEDEWIPVYYVIELLQALKAERAKLAKVGELPRFDVEYGGDEIGLYRVPTELGDCVDANELEAILKEVSDE